MRSFLLPLALLALTGCVQPTHEHTVLYRLHLPAGTNPTQVAVRGGDKPLSWERDSLLRALPGDTVYEGAIAYRTGYRFTEVKFVVDGRFELEGRPNRRVEWGDRPRLTYEVRFDQSDPLTAAK